MYSTHNEEKSVVAKRFNRTLKNKIYKYMTSISKNVYIDKLDHIVNKYNNTYIRTIKMKPVDVKPSTYIDSNKKFKKILNLKLVMLLEYLNIKAFLQKAMFVRNWSEEVFVITKVKNTVPWTLLLVILKANK